MLNRLAGLGLLTAEDVNAAFELGRQAGIEEERKRNQDTAGIGGDGYFPEEVHA